VQNVLLHQKLPLTFEEEYFATVRQQKPRDERGGD